MPAQPIYYLDALFPDEILIQIAQGFSHKELFEFGKTSPAFGGIVAEIYGKKYNGVPVKFILLNLPFQSIGCCHNGIDVLGSEACSWYLKLFGKKIIQIEVECSSLGN